MSQTNNVYAQNIPAFKQVINQPATVSDADIAAWIREFYAYLATLNLSAAYRHKELEMFHANLTLEFSDEIFESPYHPLTTKELIDIIINQCGLTLTNADKDALYSVKTKAGLREVFGRIAKENCKEFNEADAEQKVPDNARKEPGNNRRRNSEERFPRNECDERDDRSECRKKHAKEDEECDTDNTDNDEPFKKRIEDTEEYKNNMGKLLPLLDKIPDNPEDFGKPLLAGKYCDDDKKIVLYSKVIENDATNAGSVFNAYLAVFMHETFHAFHYYCGEKTDTCEVRTRQDYTAAVVKEALADAFTIAYCNQNHIYFGTLHNVMTASPIYYPYAAARFLFNDDDPTNPLDENTLYILRLILIFSLYDMTAALWLLSRHHQILIPIIKRQ